MKQKIIKTKMKQKIKIMSKVLFLCTIYFDKETSLTLYCNIKNKR